MREARRVDRVAEAPAADEKRASFQSIGALLLRAKAVAQTPCGPAGRAAGLALVILIFEGADKVGKSTLARHYADRLRCGIVKIRWELVDPAVETRAFANATHEFLGATDCDLVFDRAYLSWWAYGPALGHDVAFMPELIARFHARAPARLVVCTTAPHELRQRYQADPDRYFPLDVVLAANERFPSLLGIVPALLPALHRHDRCERGAFSRIRRRVSRVGSLKD